MEVNKCPDLPNHRRYRSPPTPILPHRRKVVVVSMHNFKELKSSKIKTLISLNNCPLEFCSS